MNVSFETIRSHRKHILMKLEARNMPHAIGIMYRNGWF